MGSVSASNNTVMNTIPFLQNSVEAKLKELASEARSGKVTYCFVLAQYEDDEHVCWQPMVMGEKSYDPEHLLNEIGQYHVITQTVFHEICAGGGEDESSD